VEIRAGRWTGGAGELAVEVTAGPATGHSEGYRLALTPAGATLRADDEAGARHGRRTLAQWLRLHAGDDGIPAVEVEDWPDLPRRGVMLDVSRDKVPSMETLLALVDLLGAWKVNQLQLYVEHTFAYRGHEVVWRHASPLTPEEVRALDAHCREQGIELVPNQNSFGHFHRWLVHEPYRQLAEVPEGLQHPFGESREPFSLCPTDPRTLALLGDLYDQLLPNFASHELNVGLDETFDLGAGRSAAAVAAKGKVRVYLEFLQQVHALVAARGHRMQFWGDIIIEQPELIPELPADAIALEWGYEADHPFADHARRFAASGLEFMVCPGTSSWNSFAGRTENALGNLALAARTGAETGARGMLITDWGDFGHLQPLPVSFLGFLAGAGFGWNARAAAEPSAFPWAALLDAHAFGDAAGGTGEAALALGNAYLHTGARQKNGTALFYLVTHPQHDLEHRRYAGMTVDGLRATEAHVERALAALVTGQPTAQGGELVRRELAWVAGLLRFACRLGSARLDAGRTVSVEALPGEVRGTLLAELAPLVAAHRDIWLARNRPGGRADSVSRLERLAALLATATTADPREPR